MAFSPILEAARLRDVFGCFPSGVSALCAVGADGTPVGLAASSFTSVSLDPPLVSVCLAHTSTTWPLLRRSRRLGVSVLGEGHSLAARLLASREADRFAGLEWEASEDGAVFIAGSTLWLDCSIHTEVPAGDHVLVLLEVHATDVYPEIAPLVFHRSTFRRLEELAGP